MSILRRSFGALAVLLVAATTAYFLRSSSNERDGGAGPSSADEPHAFGEGSSTDALGARGPAPRSPAVFDGGPVLDRRRADQIRALLRAAAARGELIGSAEPQRVEVSPTYAVMPTGVTADGGDALREYIHDVVHNDYLPLARECYESALRTTPELSGRVSVTFVVVGDERIGGAVESAEIDDELTTIIDESFRSCVTDSMLSVSSFGVPPGGKVSVTYPIEVSPRDDGPADERHERP